MLAMLKMSQSSHVGKVNTATAETTTTSMTANCQLNVTKVTLTHARNHFRLKVSMKIRIDETRPQKKRTMLFPNNCVLYQ